MQLWTKKIYAIPYVEKVYYDIVEDDIIFTIKEKDSINIGASLNYISDYGAAIKIATTVPNFGIWTQNYTLTAELSKYPKFTVNSLSFYEMGDFKILGSFDIGYKISPFLSLVREKKFQQIKMKYSVVNFLLGLRSLIVSFLE